MILVAQMVRAQRGEVIRRARVFGRSRQPEALGEADHFLELPHAVAGLVHPAVEGSAGPVSAGAHLEQARYSVWNAPASTVSGIEADPKSNG